MRAVVAAPLADDEVRLDVAVEVVGAEVLSWHHVVPRQNRRRRRAQGGDVGEQGRDRETASGNCGRPAWRGLCAFIRSVLISIAPIQEVATPCLGRKWPQMAAHSNPRPNATAALIAWLKRPSA